MTPLLPPEWVEEAQVHIGFSWGLLGDSLGSRGSADFPPFRIYEQAAFVLHFLDFASEARIQVTPRAAAKIFSPSPRHSPGNQEVGGDREVPLLVSPTGCTVSKRLALKSGVKSSVSNSVPIFCWNYSNPRPQHTQNYELNTDFPSIFNSCGYESVLICPTDMLASRLPGQSKGFNCFA